LIRVQVAPGRRIWVACDQGATVIVRSKGHRKDAIKRLEERAHRAVGKVVRHPGVMSLAETDMILSDHRMGRTK
jgi:hypothetical protein